MSTFEVLCESHKWTNENTLLLEEVVKINTRRARISHILGSVEAVGISREMTAKEIPEATVNQLSDHTQMLIRAFNGDSLSVKSLSIAALEAIIKS